MFPVFADAGPPPGIVYGMLGIFTAGVLFLAAIPVFLGLRLGRWIRGRVSRFDAEE